MKRLALLLLITSLITTLSVPAQPLAPTRKAADPDLNALKREAVVEVEKLQKLTQEMVDSIFSFAELGFQEYETSKYITGILEKNGFKIERGVVEMPTAWTATYG